MIERQIVNGRPATVAYLTNAFEPADADTAQCIKVLFDDGDVVFLASPIAGDTPGNPT